MKMVPRLFMSLLLATPIGAIADPNILPSNVTDNPYAQSDPDGVPLTVTQGRTQRPPTPAEIDAFRKQQEQAAYDKNWLLRSYEEQLRLHDPQGSGKEADSDANLYYQLSLNKDITKLVRLPDASTDSTDNGSALKVNASPTGTHPTTLRTDPDTKPESLSLSNYKPLITPMSALDAVTQHDNFSTFKPSTPFSPFADDNTQPAPAPKAAPDSNLDSVDMETPGMVSAKKDLSDPDLSDLTLDTLPGETADQARARIEMNQDPHLPVLMDADELHREQAATLSPAGMKQLPAALTTGTATPPVAQPVPQVDEAPMPVSKMQQINPVRAPIANPYDYLNR